MTSLLFRKRLRQLRLEKGVEQKRMSTDLHMTDNYIYNIEAGYAYPSMTQFFLFVNIWISCPMSS